MPAQSPSATSTAPTMAPEWTVGLKWALAIACAVSVSNLYYIQPLLVQIRHTFGINSSQAGLAATMCQIGYALGMVFIVPLGDAVERKRLVLSTVASSIVLCLAVALAPNYLLLLAACLCLGLSTCTPQLLVPLAAHLAPSESRGRAVGFVMSGLLIGILLARTVSGFVGQAMGWRTMFIVAAFFMGALYLWLRATLPKVPPEGQKISYRELLASLGKLLRDHPILQESAFFGAMVFFAFSAFWTALTFLLAAPPFGFGPNAAGLFGLVGAGGALAAGAAGRISDRGNPRHSVAIGIGLLLLSWVIFFFGRANLIWLVVGTLLLDVGTQGSHISNQTRAFTLVPSARSRLNTIYMTCYFIGGSAGSATGGWAYGAYGWSGVCAAGAGACVLGLITWVLHHKRQAKSLVAQV